MDRDTLSSNEIKNKPLAMIQKKSEDKFALMMKSAQDGDSRAYSNLLQEIAPRLRKMVRNQRRLLRQEDIEDLVQEILLSLHAVRATYDPQRPFMPWLFAITRNRLADNARHYARRLVHEVQVENLPVTFVEQDANRDDGVYGDPDELRQAIGSLPPGQRKAVEMLKLGELSLKEAAAKSGMSVGALKVSIHRAMISLRKILTKE